jgi:dienelactone hydrolase
MINKPSEQLVSIPVDSVALEGALSIPAQAEGIVLFAHGSGSSRHSPRNNFVARVLQSVKLGTLLMDLLTQKEDEVYRTRFDIELLAHRLTGATKWLMHHPQAKGLGIGYFGASTGAAAALSAAAVLGQTIGAVVSRGGRPDLAGPFLSRVQAPTLLIVGGLDDAVISLNRQACEQIKAEKKLVIVPGATHLFEQPGTLEKVADLAARWFRQHLGPQSKKH